MWSSFNHGVFHLSRNRSSSISSQRVVICKTQRLQKKQTTTKETIHIKWKVCDCFWPWCIPLGKYDKWFKCFSMCIESTDFGGPEYKCYKCFWFGSCTQTQCCQSGQCWAKTEYGRSWLLCDFGPSHHVSYSIATVSSLTVCRTGDRCYCRCRLVVDFCLTARNLDNGRQRDRKRGGKAQEAELSDFWQRFIPPPLLSIRMLIQT